MHHRRFVRHVIREHLDKKNDIENHNGHGPIHCSVCHKEFEKPMEYLAHEHYACNKTCTLCGKSFTNKERFINHMLFCMI